MPTSLLRGQVYRAKLGNTEPKYYLVVSNNRRNAALDDVLVVRLTTTAKPTIPSIVDLQPPRAERAKPATDELQDSSRCQVPGRTALASAFPQEPSSANCGCRISRRYCCMTADSDLVIGNYGHWRFAA